jgi:excisionase family DNA binding protein
MNQNTRFCFENEADRELARNASRRLSPLVGRRGNVDAGFTSDHAKVEVTLPEAMVPLLIGMLSDLAMGKAIMVLPVDAELTTQQAADFLNVSRPFLIKQLDSNVIDHRKVGTHRRVLLKDVIEYKQSIDSARAKDLDELTKQAQELGMEY